MIRFFILFLVLQAALFGAELTPFVQKYFVIRHYPTILNLTSEASASCMLFILSLSKPQRLSLCKMGSASIQHTALLQDLNRRFLISGSCI